MQTKQIPKTSAAVTPENVKPPNLRKRIGSTIYVVTVHFSDKSKETLNDKIMKLIEREVQDNA